MAMSVDQVAELLTRTYRDRLSDRHWEEPLEAAGWKDLGSAIEGAKPSEWYWRLSLEDPKGKKYDFTLRYARDGESRKDAKFEYREQ